MSSAASHRAEWLRDARWGVMIHFLPEWLDPQRTWTPDAWNKAVDGFDVVGVAKQLHEVGARYCVITIGQNSGYYASPNATYDRLVGHEFSHCARRDLIGELATALAERDIRTIAYLTAGPPARDEPAAKALEWAGNEDRNRAFQINWEQVIRDWSRRWGDRVSGWWFDGTSRPNLMYRSHDAPNFETFAAAARGGNPRAIVAFNGGMFYPVLSLTPQEDYTAGIIYDFERPFVSENRVTNGILDGVQLHIVSFLGETWGRGRPRFSATQMANITKRINALQGAITWDVPVQPNGLIPDAYLKQLRGLKAR